MTNGDDGKPIRVAAESAVPQSKAAVLVWMVEKLGVPTFLLVLLFQLALKPMLDSLIDTNKAHQDIAKQSAVTEALQTNEMKEQSALLQSLKLSQDATRTAVETSDKHKADGTEQLLSEARKTREVISAGTVENRKARETNMRLLMEAISGKRLGDGAATTSPTEAANEG